MIRPLNYLFEFHTYGNVMSFRLEKLLGGDAKMVKKRVEDSYVA